MLLKIIFYQETKVPGRDMAPPQALDEIPLDLSRACAELAHEKTTFPVP